ncbi:MFS transporter [Microbacterium sp. SYP-A9085]|uniref:MFS transporter n=1 Tax=Microbacterium sp. SYP-A9085 TaxID=2664454 RepID=UPI003464ABC4
MFTQLGNITFSTAQGVIGIVVPLLAVHAGHPIGVVGIIVAISAVSQTVARVGMGALMSRFPTKYFIVVATILSVISCTVLWFSAALWAFVVQQLLQGVARAYFWTGAQTHVVRGSDSAVAALSRFNVVQGVGQLIGPVLAGVVGGWSLPGGMLIAAGLSGFALLPALALARFEPFAAKPRAKDGDGDGRWTSSPGVRTAASMTAVAGAWRGVLNSYLPVILTAAGHSIPVVGVLVTLTNLASLGGTAVAGRVQAKGPRVANMIGTASAGLGMAVAVLFPGPIMLVGVALAVAGAGAGVLQTIGLALAADSVGPDDRGRVIAVMGAFRSTCLLVSPLGTAGLVMLLPSASIAAGITSLVISTPAFVSLFSRKGRQGGAAEKPMS